MSDSLASNILPLTKKCSKCKEFREVDKYYQKNGKRNECKSCTKKRTRAWHIKNSYRQHKKTYCENCGFVALDSCQLDVDHIDGNHKNDAIENLKTLCANCHRLKTRIEHNYSKGRRS